MKSISSNVNCSSSHLNEKQWSILQKLIKNLSVVQIIWISGYLYGLVIKSDPKLKSSDTVMLNAHQCTTFPVTSTISSDNCITIVSASQTGNARALAKKLHQSLMDEKFNVRLINISDYNFKKIVQEKLLFLIISTYGEGEPPEEAVMFYKYLFSHRAPSLKEMSFSVFGLGDRSYEYFSKSAKDFDNRFEELGAYRIYPRVDADLDYQEQANIWRQEIIGLLKKQCMVFNIDCDGNNVDNVLGNVITDLNSFVYSKIYTKDSLFYARLLVRQKITSRSALKDVYHLEIDLSDSGIYYQPGDSLGIWYENDFNLVAELLKYCKFTGKEKVSIHGQLLPFDVVLQKYYELTHNTPLVAKNYAELINNDELLSIFVDDAALKKFVLSTSIIDMIRSWSPIELSPQELLSVLRPLTPRFYSISSSQQEVGDEVHITVAVVRYEVNGHVRRGGASGYLVNQLSEGSKLRVFIVSNDSFRLPNDLNASIIMIAAGTGIAPFRAFMQQRLSDGALGKNWLFFGNLCFLDDFLYQREWQRYIRDGLLTYINTAWSRDQSNKIYVQDKIVENGLKVWKWIQNGAYIYVCGDATRMAASVERSLIQLGIEYGKMNFKESSTFLDNMRVMRRYQKDVY